jgi:hypothetical protein
MNESAKRAIEMLKHPDFELTPEMEEIASANGCEMTVENWVDLFRIAGVASDELRRKTDPQARNHPQAASIASDIRRGVFSDENQLELMKQLIGGQLPEKFLATVERLVSAPDVDSKERAYLNALIDFYLEKGEWPYAHALDRHAIALHPQLFSLINIDEISTDERKAFRRLRKNLGIDWLPKGPSGRPSK